MPVKRTLDDMLNTPDAADDPELAEAAAVDPIEQAAPRPKFDPNKKFGADEVMTPRLALAQALSPEVRAKTAEAGQFLLMGNEPEDSVKLVISAHSDTRRFVEQGQQRARCWSPDGIQGYGDPGILCADCPFSKWTDSGKKDANGKTINLRPPCDEIDSFVAFSITHGMPVIWPLKGTASKAARFIKTLANGLGLGNFAIEVTSVEKTSPARAWYEPVITIDHSIDQQTCNRFRDIALGAVSLTAPVLTAEAGADA